MRTGRFSKEWDEESFRALHERTARPLWAYITHLVHDSSIAEDIVQQAYINILQSPTTSSLDAAHLKNYLFKTATNLANDHFRKQGHFLSVTEVEIPAPETTVDYDLICIMAELSAKDRELLLLAYNQGLSHREIASILHYKEASVRPLLARARARLQEILRRHGVNVGRARGSK